MSSGFTRAPLFELLLAFNALVYAGPVLLALAVLLLALPASRRQAWLRRTAYVLLALDLCLLVLASPVLALIWDDYTQKREFEALTHHLTAPQIFAGTTFPAGSTVHVSKEGVPEYGILPDPTPVGGLVLIGRFRLHGNDGTGAPLAVAQGMLAAPATIHDIPCGPGAVELGERATTCVLAREWEFAGHALAAEQLVDVWHSPPQETPLLYLGTLARSELLYDVQWPAGTVVSGVTESPERMEHKPGPGSHGVEFCLRPGSTATIPGAVLHGSMTYVVDGNQRIVWPACSSRPGTQSSYDGYAEVGPDRHAWGKRPDARSPWRWGRSSAELDPP